MKAQSAEADIKAQESEVATADYDRQMASLVLESTVIRSPSAGVVAEVLVGVGDLVSPTTSIAYVVDTDPMLLVASVNENDMPSVKVGQTATVTQSAYPDLEFTGVVRSIDLHATTSNNVSTFAATVEVSNKDGRLLWGMNADAQIVAVSVKDTLTLPSSAIKTTSGASTVSVLDGGTLESRTVKIGATDGSRTEILAGLEEGQEVISRSGKSSTSTSATVAKAASVQSLGSILGGAGGPPSGGPPPAP